MMIKITAIFILTSVFIIGCNDNKPVPVIKHVEQKVALTSGVSVDNKNLVVLNPINGQPIDSCQESNTTDYEKQGDTTKEKNYPKNNTGCSVEVVDPSESLRNLIEASKTPINGKIKKNGKEMQATFISEVTAVYQGSYCSTKYSLGSEYQNCISIQNRCQILGNSPIPKAVILQSNPECKPFI